MTKQQALKKWAEIYRNPIGCGEPAVRDGGKRLESSPERRAEASAELKRLNKLCTTHELRKQYRKERDYWLGEVYRYRYTIGHLGLGGLFFGVDGSGDTWEDCFKDYEARRAAYRKAA